MVTLEQILALYAGRLRDEADSDYVAARHLYRLGLRPQFLWPAQQAIEKYLKSTLLFFGQRIRETHDLNELFSALERTLVDDRGLSITFPHYLPHFLFTMTAFGTNWYATSFAYTTGCELLELDEVVWCLRRYCDHPLIFRGRSSSTDRTPEHFKYLNGIGIYENPRTVRLFAGELERFLRDGESALATALRAGNNYFGDPAEAATVHLSSEVAFPMRRSVEQWLDEGGGVHRAARLSELNKYVPGMEKAYNDAQDVWPGPERRTGDMMENEKTPFSKWTRIHPYVGNNRSNIFHKRKCQNQKGIAEKNRIGFETVSQATAQGYSAAPCCT